MKQLREWYILVAAAVVILGGLYLASASMTSQPTELAQSTSSSRPARRRPLPNQKYRMQTATRARPRRRRRHPPSNRLRPWGWATRRQPTRAQLPHRLPARPLTDRSCCRADDEYVPLLLPLHRPPRRHRRPPRRLRQATSRPDARSSRSARRAIRSSPARTSSVRHWQASLAGSPAPSRATTTRTQ